MKNHDWIYLMFTTIICCTTIITIAQAQQRGRVKFGLPMQKDETDTNTSPEIVSLANQTRGSASHKASSRFRAAIPSAIPIKIEENKESPRSVQRGSRGRANDRSSRKLTAEATEAIPLVRSRKRINPAASTSSSDQPIKIELPPSSIDRTNVIRRSKTRSEPASSTSPPAPSKSIRRRSDVPSSDGPSTEGVRKVRTFTSRSVTKQADEVISSENPLIVATTGSNWRNVAIKRGASSKVKSSERKSKALDEDQLEDENYPEHFKLLLRKQQPSPALLPKNYPKLPIQEDQTYSKLNEIYEVPRAQGRLRRLEQTSQETSDEILQVSRAIPKVRRVELKREDTSRAALKTRRIEPRPSEENIKSAERIEEPSKSRRSDADKLRAQVKINKATIKSRNKETSNEVQREDIPKLPSKSNRRTESSTEDNEPEVKPNEIEESSKASKSLFLPRRAEPYRPKPKTTTQRPTTTSKPIKKPEVLAARTKFKNRLNSRLQFPSLRTKTSSTSDEVMKYDNEVVHTSPVPQPVRPLQITKSRNLALDRPAVDERPKPKQQKFSSRYRGDAFSRYQQKTEPSKPIYTPTIPALTTEPIPPQLCQVTPYNLENQDLNKSGSNFEGIVYDGTAGVWNMVEPVAGGLTRSEISVDSGGVEQPLMAQSSVTVSIFEALADILSKTPSTTTSTTTTTTTSTTTSTTELPDIIQVPEQKIVSISSTTVNTHDPITDVMDDENTTTTNAITNNDRDGRLLNSVEINPSTTIFTPTTTLSIDTSDSLETKTVPQYTSDTTLLSRSQTEQTTLEFSDFTTLSLPASPTQPTLTNTNLTNISTNLLELTTLASNPPTSLPMPFLADALTTPGSSLITQPQLISAISNFLDTSVQNASETMASATENTTKTTTTTATTMDTNNNLTDASTTLSPPLTTTFSPSSTGSPPVTISFLDLFTIQAKKVNQNTEPAVEVHPIYKGPESTTTPVGVEKKQTTGQPVNINTFFGTQTYPSISITGSSPTDRALELSSIFSENTKVTGGETTDTTIPSTSILEQDTSTLDYTTSPQSSIRTQSLPIHLNSILGSTQKYDQTSPFKTVQTEITTTVRSRFGNRRIPILPAGTVQSTTNKISTPTQTSSTTPVETTTTTVTQVSPEINQQQLSNVTTTTTTTSSTTKTTTEQKPIQDFSVYGILPNNTVVRKRPPQVSRQLDIGIMVYGILPNQTVVRKYPNGTLMIVDSSKDVEVVDIDPKMLFNPFSELYRTSQSSLLLTTHRSTTSHRLIESNHILSSSSSSPSTEVPNNFATGSGRRGNSIKETTESGNTDSALTTNTDDENLIQWLSENEDNILNSTILFESNTENAVLLDILKRKYIKTDLPSRSSNVVSLTTARNVIEENSIQANKEEDVSENTLFDSSEEKKKDPVDDFFLSKGSVLPNRINSNNKNDEDNVISKQFDTSYANVGIGSIFAAGNKGRKLDISQQRTKLYPINYEMAIPNTTTKLFPIHTLSSSTMHIDNHAVQKEFLAEVVNRTHGVVVENTLINGFKTSTPKREGESKFIDFGILESEVDSEANGDYFMDPEDRLKIVDDGFDFDTDEGSGNSYDSDGEFKGFDNTSDYKTKSGLDEPKTDLVDIKTSPILDKSINSTVNISGQKPDSEVRNVDSVTTTILSDSENKNIESPFIHIVFPEGVLESSEKFSDIYTTVSPLRNTSLLFKSEDLIPSLDKKEKPKTSHNKNVGSMIIPQDSTTLKPYVDRVSEDRDNLMHDTTTVFTTTLRPTTSGSDGRLGTDISNLPLNIKNVSVYFENSTKSNDQEFANNFESNVKNANLGLLDDGILGLKNESLLYSIYQNGSQFETKSKGFFGPDSKISDDLDSTHSYISDNSPTKNTYNNFASVESSEQINLGSITNSEPEISSSNSLNSSKTFVISDLHKNASKNIAPEIQTSDNISENYSQNKTSVLEVPSTILNDSLLLEDHKTLFSSNNNTNTSGNFAMTGNENLEGITTKDHNSKIFASDVGFETLEDISQLNSELPEEHESFMDNSANRKLESMTGSSMDEKLKSENIQTGILHKQAIYLKSVTNFGENESSNEVFSHDNNFEVLNANVGSKPNEENRVLNQSNTEKDSKLITESESLKENNSNPNFKSEIIEPFDLNTPKNLTISSNDANMSVSYPKTVILDELVGVPELQNNLTKILPSTETKIFESLDGEENLQGLQFIRNSSELIPSMKDIISPEVSLIDKELSPRDHTENKYEGLSIVHVDVDSQNITVTSNSTFDSEILHIKKPITEDSKNISNEEQVFPTESPTNPESNELNSNIDFSPSYGLHEGKIVFNVPNEKLSPSQKQEQLSNFDFSKATEGFNENLSSANEQNKPYIFAAEIKNDSNSEKNKIDTTELDTDSVKDLNYSGKLSSAEKNNISTEELLTSNDEVNSAKKSNSIMENHAVGSEIGGLNLSEDFTSKKSLKESINGIGSLSDKASSTENSIELGKEFESTNRTPILNDEEDSSNQVDSTSNSHTHNLDIHSFVTVPKPFEVTDLNEIHSTSPSDITSDIELKVSEKLGDEFYLPSSDNQQNEFRNETPDDKIIPISKNEIPSPNAAVVGIKKDSSAYNSTANDQYLASNTSDTSYTVLSVDDFFQQFEEQESPNQSISNDSRNELPEASLKNNLKQLEESKSKNNSLENIDIYNNESHGRILNNETLQETSNSLANYQNETEYPNSSGNPDVNILTNNLNEHLEKPSSDLDSTAENGRVNNNLSAQKGLEKIMNTSYSQGNFGELDSSIDSYKTNRFNDSEIKYENSMHSKFTDHFENHNNSSSMVPEFSNESEKSDNILPSSLSTNEYKSNELSPELLNSAPPSSEDLMKNDNSNTEIISQTEALGLNNTQSYAHLSKTLANDRSKTQIESVSNYSENSGSEDEISHNTELLENPDFKEEKQFNNQDFNSVVISPKTANVTKDYYDTSNIPKDNTIAGEAQKIQIPMIISSEKTSTNMVNSSLNSENNDQNGLEHKRKNEFLNVSKKEHSGTVETEIIQKNKSGNTSVEVSDQNYSPNATNESIDQDFVKSTNILERPAPNRDLIFENDPNSQKSNLGFNDENKTSSKEIWTSSISSEIVEKGSSSESQLPNNDSIKINGIDGFIPPLSPFESEVSVSSNENKTNLYSSENETGLTFNASISNDISNSKPASVGDPLLFSKSNVSNNDGNNTVPAYIISQLDSVFSIGQEMINTQVTEEPINITNNVSQPIFLDPIIRTLNISFSSGNTDKDLETDRHVVPRKGALLNSTEEPRNDLVEEVVPIDLSEIISSSTNSILEKDAPYKNNEEILVSGLSNETSGSQTFSLPNISRDHLEETLYSYNQIKENGRVNNNLSAQKGLEKIMNTSYSQGNFGELDSSIDSYKTNRFNDSEIKYENSMHSKFTDHFENHNNSSSMVPEFSNESEKSDNILPSSLSTNEYKSNELSPELLNSAPPSSEDLMKNDNSNTEIISQTEALGLNNTQSYAHLSKTLANDRSKTQIESVSNYSENSGSEDEISYNTELLENPDFKEEKQFNNQDFNSVVISPKTANVTKDYYDTSNIPKDNTIAGEAQKIQIPMIISSEKTSTNMVNSSLNSENNDQNGLEHKRKNEFLNVSKKEHSGTVETEIIQKNKSGNTSVEVSDQNYSPNATNESIDQDFVKSTNILERPAPNRDLIFENDPNSQKSNLGFNDENKTSSKEIWTSSISSEIVEKGSSSESQLPNNDSIKINGIDGFIPPLSPFESEVSVSSNENKTNLYSSENETGLTFNASISNDISNSKPASVGDPLLFSKSNVSNNDGNNTVPAYIISQLDSVFSIGQEMINTQVTEEPINITNNVSQPIFLDPIIRTLNISFSSGNTDKDLETDRHVVPRKGALLNSTEEPRNDLVEEVVPIDLSEIISSSTNSILEKDAPYKNNEEILVSGLSNETSGSQTFSLPNISRDHLEETLYSYNQIKEDGVQNSISHDNSHIVKYNSSSVTLKPLPSEKYNDYVPTVSTDKDLHKASFEISSTETSISTTSLESSIFKNSEPKTVQKEISSFQNSNSHVDTLEILPDLHPVTLSKPPMNSTLQSSFVPEILQFHEISITSTEKNGLIPSVDVGSEYEEKYSTQIPILQSADQILEQQFETSSVKSVPSKADKDRVSKIILELLNKSEQDGRNISDKTIPSTNFMVENSHRNSDEKSFLDFALPQNTLRTNFNEISSNLSNSSDISSTTKVSLDKFQSFEDGSFSTGSQISGYQSESKDEGIRMHPNLISEQMSSSTEKIQTVPNFDDVHSESPNKIPSAYSLVTASNDKFTKPPAVFYPVNSHKSVTPSSKLKAAIVTPTNIYPVLESSTEPDQVSMIFPKDAMPTLNMALPGSLHQKYTKESFHKPSSVVPSNNKNLHKETLKKPNSNHVKSPRERESNIPLKSIYHVSNIEESSSDRISTLTTLETESLIETTTPTLAADKPQEVPLFVPGGVPTELMSNTDNFILPTRSSSKQTTDKTVKSTENKFVPGGVPRDLIESMRTVPVFTADTPLSEVFGHFPSNNIVPVNVPSSTTSAPLKTTDNSFHKTYQFNLKMLKSTIEKVENDVKVLKETFIKSLNKSTNLIDPIEERLTRLYSLRNASKTNQNFLDKSNDFKDFKSESLTKDNTSSLDQLDLLQEPLNPALASVSNTPLMKNSKFNLQTMMKNSEFKPSHSNPVYQMSANALVNAQTINSIMSESTSDSVSKSNKNILKNNDANQSGFNTNSDQNPYKTVPFSETPQQLPSSEMNVESWTKLIPSEDTYSPVRNIEAHNQKHTETQYTIQQQNIYQESSTISSLGNSFVIDNLKNSINTIAEPKQVDRQTTPTIYVVTPAPMMTTTEMQTTSSSTTPSSTTTSTTPSTTTTSSTTQSTTTSTTTPISTTTTTTSTTTTPIPIITETTTPKPTIVFKAPSTTSGTIVSSQSPPQTSTALNGANSELEKNIKLLEQLLQLQSSLNTKPSSSSTTTTSTPSSTTTTTKATEAPTKTIAASSADDEQFINQLRQLLLSQQQAAKKPTTSTTTTTPKPTTTTTSTTTIRKPITISPQNLQDLLNSFSTPSFTSTTAKPITNVNDIEFLNSLREIGKIQVTTSAPTTFANRIIELALKNRPSVKPTSPVYISTTVPPFVPMPEVKFPQILPSNEVEKHRQDQASLSADLSLLSSLLGRRITIADLPQITQQFGGNGAKSVPASVPRKTSTTTSTPRTTRKTTTTTERPMTRDEIAEIEKNLHLLSSLLGRPVSLSELPLIMQELRSGRKPKGTAASGAKINFITPAPFKTTTTVRPIPDVSLPSQTPVSQEEVIALLKDPSFASPEQLNIYGQSDDAILAAVLKQRGIGPVHNNLPINNLFAQEQTQKPYRPTRPPPPPPPQRRPVLDGLAWLWRTWQETAAPGNRVSKSNRQPTASASTRLESPLLVGAFGGDTPTPTVNSNEGGEYADLQYPQNPSFGQGNGLLTAAFGVTRAVSQFLGAAFQGAAKSVQSAFSPQAIQQPSLISLSG